MPIYIASIFSSSGQYVVATVQNGDIYISEDFGDTFLPTDSISAMNWAKNGLDIDATGRVVGVAVYEGYVYLNSNYGKGSNVYICRSNMFYVFICFSIVF